MLEAVEVVSALRPSVVSRTRETGAPPPTCTGRPSIPLILFAIALTPESSTCSNGWFPKTFSVDDDYLAQILFKRSISHCAGRSGTYAYHTLAFGNPLPPLERIEVLDPQSLGGTGVG